MPRRQLDAIVRHIHDIAGRPAVAHLTDKELLQRFAHHRDEQAFAELVRRHGDLVLGVCQRVLNHSEDCEDVFQATFLVLARKAAAGPWRDSVEGWLHEVALRLAQKVKTTAARRHALQEKAMQARKPQCMKETIAHELFCALDEELHRLPATYRLPLLLCYLRAKTRDQAARQLGLTLRTLDRRLARGRELLRARLTRRGLTLSTALLAAEMSQNAAAGGVSSALATTTARAALTFIAGKTAGGAGLSAAAAALAEAGRRGLLAVNTLLLCLAAGVVAAGGGLLAHQMAIVADQPIDPMAEQSNAQPDVPRKDDREKSARTDRYGDPLPEHAIARMGTVRLRHGDNVHFIALTADGKRCVSADCSRIFVWETATGKQVRRIGGDFGTKLRGFHLSPDDKILVSLTQGQWNHVQDGLIQVWDFNSGKELRQICCERHGTMQLSPDGRKLAWFNEKTIHVFDIETGKELSRFTGHSEQVHTVAFFPDGKTVASGADDKTIRLWDAATGKEIRRLGDQPLPVLQIALSPDGKLLAAVGCTKTESKSSTSNTTVICWGADNTVHLWDVATSKSVGQLKAAGNTGIGTLAFSPDGKTLFTASEGFTRIWDALTRQERAR